jgi:murein DD-endopeptidase MepM/ murein hydrolase activator NlpD
MPAAKKTRGATAIRSDQRRLPHKHLLAVALISAVVAIATILTPSSNTEAIKPAQLEAAARVAETEAAVERVLDATAEPATLDNLEPALMPPAWEEQTVRSGDNLSLIFKRAGLNDRDVYSVINTAKDGKLLSKIYPGQIIGFQKDDTGVLTAVQHRVSRLETITFSREGPDFSSERTIRTPELREAWASAEITSSLYMAGQDAGLSQNMIMELANVFGGVIDFILDPRKGDTIHLIYEELYLDGEKYKDGELIAAAFTNQGKTFTAYRYEDSSGDIGYYNEDGVSMRKAFLMAPLDFRRVSSNFNMARKHPIYKTTRPHRGTDYAAARGTPVFAAGDGRVVKAGYTKANGNYVFIQHGEAYVTKYLHLHKRNVKTGQRVSQSQVIGTVGSTGAATGPHLHYEFLVNGVHRNPRTIHTKLPKAKALPASEKSRFQDAIQGDATQLARLMTEGSSLAMNSEPQASAP